MCCKVFINYFSKYLFLVLHAVLKTDFPSPHKSRSDIVTQITIHIHLWMNFTSVIQHKINIETNMYN